MATKEEAIDLVFKKYRDIKRIYFDKMENRMKDSIREGYNAGFNDGCAAKSEELHKARDEAYQNGFEVGKNAADCTEYRRGYEDGSAQCGAYQRGYDEGYQEGMKRGEYEGSSKSIINQIYEVADEKKKAEYQRGFKDGRDSIMNYMKTMIKESENG